VSESSGVGDTAVMEQTAADHRLELKLRFESRDYTLPQLRRRLQDVEALLLLLLADKTLLPLTSGKRVITIALIPAGTSMTERKPKRNRRNFSRA
jgi:hypothetical protein